MASASARLQLIEARRIAREHSLFIVEKPGRRATDYIVYRAPAGVKPIRLWRRGNPDELLRQIRIEAQVAPCPR